MSMVDEPGFGAALAMLNAGITHHVEEEEAELLPSLKSTISREEWLLLGDAIAKAKADAGAPLPSRPSRRSTTRTTTSKR